MSKRITLKDIAGYCPEEAIWKMIADLGQSVKDAGHCPMSPDEVIVDGVSFLTDDHGGLQEQYLAPECNDGTPCGQRQQIWTLGALIYYASSGRTLFGGHGGAYQRRHPNVLLPSLRKSHSSLSVLMQQCLQHDMSSRIGIDKLLDEARKGLENCRKTKRGHNKGIEELVPSSATKQRKDHWPEEMIEMT